MLYIENRIKSAHYLTKWFCYASPREAYCMIIIPIFVITEFTQQYFVNITVTIILHK